MSESVEQQPQESTSAAIVSGSADEAPPEQPQEQPLKEANTTDTDPEDTAPLTDPDKGLDDKEVEASREQNGRNEIPVKEIPLYMLFLRQFVGFLPFLIELAAIVSLAVGDYTDFGIIAAMLIINALLGFREEYHAKKSLDELANAIDSEVATRRNGETINVNTKELVVGDVVLLVGGTIIPADMKWIKGDTMSIDTAAMTGEPIPRKYPSSDHGDVMLSGTTVVSGECYGQILGVGVNTEIGKAQADILQDKSVRIVSVFQQKIMNVVAILILSSLVMVIAVLLVEGIAYNGFQEDLKKTILDALSIMIASIPIALPLVLQVNLALGASFLAKEYHAIVTSIPALQDIASMSMLCSDKTGTLTTANMSIITQQIYAAEGYTNAEVIMYAYLCSNADKKDDPIDSAIVRAFNESEYKDTSADYQQTDIIGFNPTVKRVVSFVDHKDGKTYTIAKGLPAKIMDTEAGAPDDHELQWKVDRINDEDFVKGCADVDVGLSKSGYKTIGIAICEGNARVLGDNAVWKFVGLLPMLDPPRHDTPATIASLHHANISVKMITGDHVNVGKETARLIGMGTDIRAGEEIRNAQEEEKKKLIWDADGFAAVLPSDKREAVMTLRNEFGLVTGMTGDGVNDAPALSAAQVGIAVEGATDAAKNAADLILTKPGLQPIYGAVLESRRIFARIKSYVVYRVAASIILVLTLSIIIFTSGCAVDTLLIIVLALLNDVSMIPVAYDKANATTKPQLPNAKNLVLTSLYYGCFQTVLGIMFIYVMDSQNDLYVPIELERQCTKETQAFIWYHLVLQTELMIFSTRAPGFFLQKSMMPSWKLVVSVLGTCVLGLIIGIFYTDLRTPYLRNYLWITIFNLGSFVIVDAGKLWFKRAIHDEPGEIIETDDLVKVTPPEEETEAKKHMEKEMRYVVHRESILPESDRYHKIEVRSRTKASSLLDNFVTDGFIAQRRGRTSMLSMTGFTTPLPGHRPGGRQKQASMPW